MVIIVIVRINIIICYFMSNFLLKYSFLDTPIGKLLAIGDNKLLYFLKFVDCDNLNNEVNKLLTNTKSKIISGVTEPIKSIDYELKIYFDCGLRVFNTPLCFFGTNFQKLVWNKLREIPYGQTRSYKDLALDIKYPNSYRAVACVNSLNNMLIIIPCHRVIGINGNITGYNCGVKRKRWLLEHEKNNISLKNSMDIYNM